mgnify:CR=1 FL=1
MIIFISFHYTKIFCILITEYTLFQCYRYHSNYFEKLFDCVNNLHTGESESTTLEKSITRILGEEFGHIDLKSEEGRKLIAAKSSHVGELKAVSA